MIDTSIEGIRCRAAHDVQSYQGVVRACTEGTILYEMKRHGRHLINVHWDNGLSLNVSPNEIEIIDGDVLWQ
ncbi:MAG: hypothetical protein ACREQA_24815 [Candidatus Binatia bacterium]